MGQIIILKKTRGDFVILKKLGVKM